MPKTKGQKKVILDELKEKIIRSKSMVFANFEALTVKENEELRNKLKEENSEYFVSKKTLLAMALKDADVKDFDAKQLEGKVAAIFGYEDEVAPARIVSQFQKEHENKVNFLAGILENKVLSAEEVTALSKLPTKLELYAKLVGSINAPVSGFVNVLAGNFKKVLYALKAIEEKKA